MLYVVIAAAVFLADYAVKEWVEREEMPEERRILCGKLLLRRYHNKGAFLDMGAARSSLVAVLSLLLTLAMTVVFLTTFSVRGGRLLKTGLAFLLGGAYSNTYDRLRRRYVVDYVSFPARNPALRSVVYNLSDFCIMIGALCMALSEILRKK